MRLTAAERADIHARLASWFGKDQQAFLVSHLAPTIERIVGTRVAEFQHNAVEMARKADIAETERDSALAAAASVQDRIARAEHLIDSWEHDAPDHSNPVFIGRLRETLRRDPAPVRLREDECDHEWLDRPESDTRECLVCGTERV